MGMLSVTGDVTVLKIIKSMRQAHYDIDKTRWHVQQIRPRSPRPEMKTRLSSSVLQCANQNVKSITLQASGKSQQMKFCTHAVSGPWWVLGSPAGDTWRGETDSSLTDMPERELKRMSTQTLYFHLCSDYNFHSWSEGTTVDMNWQNVFLTVCLIFVCKG